MGRLLWRRRWLLYALRRWCTIRILVLRVFRRSQWYRGRDVVLRHMVRFLAVLVFINHGHFYT